MPDREKVIKHFEYLLNDAKGDYQDFMDLTVDDGEKILALLKEQEAIVRCKDCKYHGNIYPDYCVNLEQNTNDDFYCADGERK